MSTEQGPVIAAYDRFIPRPGLPERVAVAEAEIEAILQRHGLSFALRAVKMGERVIHSELVLVNRGY